MDVLLTETAARDFGDRVRAVSADLTLLCMAPDGSLRRDGVEVTREEVAPELAWATPDLFDGDAPVRQFFGFLRHSTSLRWAQLSFAGVDSPVFAELLGRGMRLSNAHITDIPIAEFVLARVLDHFQGAARWRDAQQRQAWEPGGYREVAGTTWLVIGAGAIGSAVAVRARAFGATVIGVRRHPSGQEPVDEMIGPDGVAEALPRVDVVVLAAPATRQTRHLVDAAFLGRMRSRSVLVNIARGALVDEVALLAALDRGIPEVAILDVFDTEPLPADSPLWVHPRVVPTPHTAGGGEGQYGRAADLFVENLGRYLRDEPLLHEVDAAALG